MKTVVAPLQSGIAELSDDYIWVLTDSGSESLQICILQGTPL